jgi:1,4-alpha-glucan branching enzyme
MGFTHVEFLPVAEHPFGGSWGYQVTGYYAPTARLGSPDEFRHLVNEMHQHGVGVLIDWVPSHFPSDPWALATFDGTALYECPDRSRATHPDWGTLMFNYGRNEVRNFLIANALFWIEEYHIDGLRVDAVASMLDQAPCDGADSGHGPANPQALSFVKELNDVVHHLRPEVITIAEDWTDRPAVSRPTSEGGLGFSFRWNMGWSFDTLTYFSRDPGDRRWHHKEVTFPLWYAFSEHFILPLSHDDVVHGKRSLLRKMSGDRLLQYANLRCLLAWTWAHPGRKLLFMGGELAEGREWDHDGQLEWDRLDNSSHAGVRELVRTLNRLYRSLPALWELDSDSTGFRWLDLADEDRSILSFLRLPAGATAAVACVANLAATSHEAYRLGLPGPTRWLEVLNTDENRFGGSGRRNLDLRLEETPAHGEPFSVTITLPPLAVLWFQQSV